MKTIAKLPLVVLLALFVVIEAMMGGQFDEDTKDYDFDA